MLTCLLITQYIHQAKAMASVVKIKRGVNILGALSHAIIGGCLLRDAITNGTAKRAENNVQAKRKAYVENALKVARENNFELTKEGAEKKAAQVIPAVYIPSSSPTRICIGLSGIAFCIASLWCMKNAHEYDKLIPTAYLMDGVNAMVRRHS
jgi:hypothetical protein